MKISTIILGFAIIIGIVVRCSSSIYRVYLEKEIELNNANSQYYFGVPCFKNDIFSLIIKIPIFYELNTTDFQVAIKTFNKIPNDKEISDDSDYIILKENVSLDNTFYYYNYPFSIKNETYLSFYFYTRMGINISAYIMAENKKYDIIINYVNLLEEISIPLLYGN